LPFIRKKYVIPIASTLILAIAIFFIIKSRGKSQAAWDLVPSDAIAVLNSNLLKDSTSLRTSSEVEFGSLPFIKQAFESLSLLNWITPDEPIIEKTLYHKNITFSFHSRSTLGIGVVFYIPLYDEMEVKWWIKPNRADIRVLNHLFQNIIITDINDNKSRSVCSYIIKDDHLIVSAYGDLIEAVIRNSNESPTEAFNLKNQFESTNDKNFGLNLYLKRNLLTDLVFKKSHGQTSVAEFLSLFPFYQDFHFSKSPSSTLSFEALGSQKEDNYITNWLEGQKGSIFTSHQYISQQTSIFLRIAGASGEAFQSAFQSWHKTFPTEAWEKTGYYIGKDRELLISNLNAELILCQLAETNSISEGKLALVKYQNYEKLRPILAKLARLATDESNASVDSYQGYDLFSIPISEFPASIYGPIFNGFPRSYISFVAPYLVFSNSSQALRDYISDFENNLTWKQSAEMDSVLTKSDHHLSMVANPQKIKNNSEPSWYNGIYSPEIESIQYESLLKNKSAITRLSFIPKQRLTSEKVLNRTFLLNEIKWTEGESNLIALDKNPSTGSGKVLVMGPNNGLFKSTSNFRKFLYLTSLDGAIILPPIQEDFLNIGRQQLILSTHTSLYALDEDQRGVVTSFTVKTPSGKSIRAINRIDGTTEGASRFAIIDEADNVFLWEKAGSQLRKVNQFKSFNNVLSPVLSLNQLGSRSTLITLEDGQIYLMKEDGTVRNSYPIETKNRVAGAFAWSQNATTGQPEIIGVSEMGELITASISGTIQSRKQLLRPETSTRFKTVFDQNTRDWLLVRSSDSKVALLDKTGNELFELTNVSSNAQLNYHYFGSDNRIISIKSGDYTSLFDTKGKQLGDKPIPSDLPVQLTYQASYNKLFIFGKTGVNYQCWTIKLR